MNLYEIIKFSRNRIPKSYFVFADSEEESWFKAGVVCGKRDSVRKICEVDNMYNICGLMKEIANVSGRDGVCIICGASLNRYGI